MPPVPPLVDPSVGFDAFDDRRLWRWSLAGGLAAAALVCVGIATRTWIVGSVEGRWTYPYVAPFAWTSLLVFGVVAAGTLGLLAIPPTARRIPWLLLTWIVAATAAHGAIRAVAPFDFPSIFVSAGANSFYTLAQERDPDELLARFERVRREAPPHARSNMPGKTLLVHAMRALTTNPAYLAWLLVLLSNLGAVVTYGAARALFDDSRTALYAAVLYLFTPGRVLFFPLMNTVTPVIVLAFLWLAIRWLRTGTVAYALAAGVVLYGLIFFEPLPLVMGLLVLSLALAAVLRGDISVERFVVQGSVMAVVAGVVAVAMFETTGFQMWRAFSRIGEHAVEFNQLEARPYGAWVRANIMEFLFTAGPAAFGLVVTAPMIVWAATRRWRLWFTQPLVATCLGLVGVLVVTDLIGVNRGEVSRLWIFLACAIQVPAAFICARLGGRWPVALVLTAAVLQTCLAAAVFGFAFP